MCNSLPGARLEINQHCCEWPVISRELAPGEFEIRMGPAGRTGQTSTRGESYVGFVE